MTPQDLEQFIAEAERLGAKRIVLRHMIWDPKGAACFVPLMTWMLDDWEGRTQQLADEILKRASNDADDTGGAQTYSAFGVLDGQDVAQVRWTATGSRLLQHAGGPTEQSNLAGALAQQMRHNEILLRSMVELTGRSLKSVAKENERLERQVQRMAEREMAVIDKFEALASHEHERAIEIATVTKQLEHRGKALAYIEPVIPMIVAKMFGTPLSPQDGMPNSLDAFLTSIRGDQVEKIVEALDPGQVTVLQQLYKEGLARQEKRDKAAAEAAAKKAAKDKQGAAGGTNGAPAS